MPGAPHALWHARACAQGGNGGRQHQGGGSGGSGLYDYGATPPLMMQAPFMLQPPPFMHPQQPGSPWAAAMMASAQQQVGSAGGIVVDKAGQDGQDSRLAGWAGRRGLPLAA